VTKFTFAAIILSLILGFIFGEADGYLGGGPGGAQGLKITEWLNSFTGKIGTGIILTLITVGYLIFALRFKPETFTRDIPASIKKVIPGIKLVLYQLKQEDGQTPRTSADRDEIDRG
jgi:hypothetical protein